MNNEAEEAEFVDIMPCTSGEKIDYRALEEIYSKVQE